MTTYLNVPFAQRDEAKGARWDSEARKWFVPIGRDLEPFSSWLPVDPAKLASQDSVGAANGVPLSQLLAGVATVVERAFSQPVWTTAEIVRVDGDPHVYLELAERCSRDAHRESASDRLGSGRRARACLPGRDWSSLGGWH